MDDTKGNGGIEFFLRYVLLRMYLTNMEADLVAVQVKESAFSKHLREHGVRFRELSSIRENVPENRRLSPMLMLLVVADVVIVLGIGCWMHKKYNHRFLYYV